MGGSPALAELPEMAASRATSTTISGSSAPESNPWTELFGRVPSDP